MEKYQYHIFSPYRVCPLGAHVDHQHGLVTGFAIDKGVDLWFNVNEETPSCSPCFGGEKDPLNPPVYGENHVHLESRTFEGTVDFDIDAPSQVKEGHWGDYARGAKYALRKRFELKRGIKGVIQGSLPVGGLSSSAAVLIAYVMAFAKANDITLQPFEVEFTYQRNTGTVPVSYLVNEHESQNSTNRDKGQMLSHLPFFLLYEENDGAS